MRITSISSGYKLFLKENIILQQLLNCNIHSVHWSQVVVLARNSLNQSAERLGYLLNNLSL